MQLTWKDNHGSNEETRRYRSGFIPDENYGGMLTINHNDLLVNDSVLVINPDNYIRFERGRTEINKLNVALGHQQIKLNGYVPLNENDTLVAKFNEWDLSNFDLITKG